MRITIIAFGTRGEFDGADLQALDVNIQIGGTATVNYYGSPETIQESISGTASINKLGD